MAPQIFVRMTSVEKDIKRLNRLIIIEILPSLLLTLVLLKQRAE